MKNKLIFASIAACCVSFSLLADDGYHRPPGMPTSDLVAFDDYSASDSDFAARVLLGYSSFRWMLQVPQGRTSFSVILEKISQENDPPEEVERYNIIFSPSDRAKFGSDLRFFPITLLLMPDQMTSNKPWAESKTCISVLSAPDHSISSRKVIRNPFYGIEPSLTILSTSRIATPYPYKPGMWDGFGTAFDIMQHDQTNNNEVLRVRFE